MEKSSKHYFTYPPNLHGIDLATLVSMYRDRGMPKKAGPGEYFACAESGKLIKEGKWWFGQYYEQAAWNRTLTDSCEGYPLTEVELNIMGLAFAAEDGAPKRGYVEQHTGVINKLSYMIVNDLKEFGFLSINENKCLLITPRGEKALHGISRRIYSNKFDPDMLRINQDEIVQPVMEQAKKADNEQASLF